MRVSCHSVSRYTPSVLLDAVSWCPHGRVFRNPSVRRPCTLVAQQGTSGEVQRGGNSCTLLQILCEAGFMSRLKKAAKAKRTDRVVMYIRINPTEHAQITKIVKSRGLPHTIASVAAELISRGLHNLAEVKLAAIGGA